MPQIDCKKLALHLKKIVEDWKSERDGVWGGADALLIAQGKISEVENLRITALQQYLIGYLFSNLVFVITKSELIVLVSKKRADKYLAKLGAAIEEVQLDLKCNFLYDNKGDNQANYDNITNSIKSSYGGSVIGCLLREKDFYNTGKLVPPMFEHLEQQDLKFTEMRKALAVVFAIKDSDEQFIVKRVSQLAAKVLQKVAKIELVNAAENAKVISHRAFGDIIDNMIEHLPPEVIGKLSQEEVEMAYPTLIRTGRDAGEVFKVGMQNSESNMSYDVALLSVGVKYLNYNACVTRTLVFSPSRHLVSDKSQDEFNFEHL